MEAEMKPLKAERMKIKLGDHWESPPLHILLTKEDDVIVARCLDFTVSSHGKDETEALNSLAEAIREYILTALENQAVESVYDPAHGKYWRMYNEAETKKSMKTLEKSLLKSLSSLKGDGLLESTLEISNA
jgi:predicted RNase H-like HicB family nuclease